jgi:hypothetical protein
MGCSRKDQHSPYGGNFCRGESIDVLCNNPIHLSGKYVTLAIETLFRVRDIS